MKTSRAGHRRVLPGSPFNRSAPPPPVEQYDLNDRVTNDKYGLGRIIGVEAGVAVLVDFGSVQKRITTPFTGLTRL